MKSRAEMEDQFQKPNLEYIFFYQNIKWSRSSVFFSSKKINLYIFNVSVLKKIPVMESMAFLSLKDITSAKPEVVLPFFFLFSTQVLRVRFAVSNPWSQ